MVGPAVVGSEVVGSEAVDLVVVISNVISLEAVGSVVVYHYFKKYIPRRKAIKRIQIDMGPIRIVALP